MGPRSAAWLLVLTLSAACAAPSPARTGPVIDMHLHANPVDPANAKAIQAMRDLPCASSNEDLMHETMAALRDNHVALALVSGTFALVWQNEAPDALWLGARRTDPLPLIRQQLQSGTCRAIAEFAPQYAGLPPNDPSLEPYYELAVEFDVPLGIHIGPGPPGAAYSVAPRYRMRHSDPLLLEEVLLRHPQLRIFVMHAGWPMLDEMVGLMHAHPQVYVELGVIDWALPEAEFHHYLSRLVGAGYGDRIMFGSDQMDCPAAIGAAILRIESAEYLDARQKRAILYDNAARFLRLSAEEIARHHARPGG